MRKLCYLLVWTVLLIVGGCGSDQKTESDARQRENKPGTTDNTASARQGDSDSDAEKKNLQSILNRPVNDPMTVTRPDRPMDSRATRERPAKGKTIQKGETVRPFKAKTWDGKDIDIDRLKGKYVLLDFWASWCGPCRAEIPYVKRLADKYKDNDSFAVIGISLDRSELPLKEFIKKFEMDWPNVFDGSQGKVASLYGVQSIPFTVLIDPEGNVIATRLRGPAMMREMDKLLDSGK